MNTKTVNKPILSISLLVSNRKDTIRKCMESIRPLLEQLPAELIAVDTVGEATDGSIFIVKEYTSQVYPFTWCNDFSAARNEGLKRAKGEWFLFLDDDEWFDDVSEIITFFRSGEYKKYNSATYQIHDYRTKDGYSVGRLNRMVKLEETTRFEGVVHEYLTPLRLPCKDLSSFIYHYGYQFETEEAKQKHAERNLSLLVPEFEKHPEDLRLRLQLVQEYLSLEVYKEQVDKLCEEAFLIDRSQHAAPAFQWLLTAYVKVVEHYGTAEEVIHRIDYLKTITKPGNFATIGLGIMELRAVQNLNCHERAEACLEAIEQAYNELVKHPEKQLLQRILDFDVLLEPSVLAEAFKDGILSLLALGETEKAAKWTKKRQELLKQPVLSISLLVSNNMATIRNCMESLKPLLKELPAELVVVDTVGEENSDGSLAVAKEYTDNIVSFTWCDDFAAARNAGLFKAKGEWFLYLDDDEWFEDVMELIEFFRTGEYLLYRSGTYKIRNYKDKAGKTYSTAELGRMVKREKNTRFISRIHETFAEIFLPCKSFSSFVHHYGYVYDSAEEKRAHEERNLKLLRKELEKEPENLRLRTQMALELANFDNEGALKFCEETFQICKEQKEEPAFQWQLSLVFCLYEALGVTAEAAEETYHALEAEFGYSETAKNAISYQMTRIFLLAKNYTKAYAFVLQYFETLSFLRENPEEQQLQMVADFYRYQSQEGYLEMLHFAGYCAWQTKQFEDAWFFFMELPWEQEGYQNTEALWFAINLTAEYPNPPAFYNIIQRVMKNTVMKKELGTMMQNPVVKQRISDTMESMRNGR